MMNTMGEVATLTDKLALMPDQMLPRLAQQYKNDAITLSLILGEKNRRDRVRNAPKMQAAAMQPKVNDAVVAGMQPQLPEQVGIGALPAPNMQQMADGGIAGMPEDDGASLLYHNEPVVRMAGGGMTPEAGFVGSAGASKLTDAQLASEYRQAMLSGQQNRAQALKAELDYRAGAMKKYQQYASGGVARFNGETGSAVADIQRILQKSPYERTPQENAILEQAGYSMERRTIPADSGVANVNAYLQSLGPRIRNYLTGGASQLTDEQLAKKPAVGGALTERILRGVGSTPSDAPIYPQASYSNEGRRTAAPGVAALVSDDAAKLGAGTGGAAPTADTGAARQPQLAAPSFAGLDVGKMTRDALAAAAKEPNPFAKDVEAIGQERVKAKEAEVSGLEAIQKQFSDIYKGRKERLDTREGEIGKLKDQQLGLALLEAAATIGGTPGPTGVALTKGVGAFGRSYGAGMEKVQAAKDKITEARDRLEEVEAQRGEMSARELFKARSDVKNTMISAKDDLLKANMQMYGVNRETAQKLVDNQVKVGIAQIEQTGATARANMANRNPTLELLQAVQKDPKLAQAYQAMHGTKNDLMTQYIDFLGKNPAAGIEDFLKTKAVFSTLGGSSMQPITQLPPGASVAPR